MQPQPILRRMILLLVATLLVLLGSGCGAMQNLIDTPTPTSTPTLTPTPTPTPTPTSTPTSTPTDTLTPRPTSVPGSTFDVTTDGLTLKLVVPGCGILTMSFGGRKYVPLPSDSQLCFMTGEVINGTPTQSHIDKWIQSSGVYLLDPQGRKGLLIYASFSAKDRKIFWIFSAPDDYASNQLYLIDQLIDMP
jgi:hypothetical protein